VRLERVEPAGTTVVDERDMDLVEREGEP